MPFPQGARGLMTKPVRRLAIAVALLSLGVALVVTLYPRVQRDWTVRIATATPGGTYYPLGVQLAHILNDVSRGPIRHAFAWQTSGSQQNIKLLCNPEDDDRAGHVDRPATDRDWANLAFVPATTLAMASQDQRSEIRALAAMYMDVTQIVVKQSSGIQGLADLRGRTIYTGKNGSGTKPIAESILKAVGIEDGDYARQGADKSYDGAVDLLRRGELDAAVFCSGTPTDAVRKALDQGEGRILSLDVSPDQVSATTPAFEGVFTPLRIQGNFYEGQVEPFDTLATQVILVCRSDLDDGLAEAVLDVLFDNVAELLMVHQRAKDIRFQDASDPKLLGSVKLHPGAKKFWEREKEKLLIATGALGGKYHDIGRAIQALLTQNGIPARAIHTHGSIENASLIQDSGRSALAITQYDTALAVHLGRSRPVFQKEVPIKNATGDPIRIEGMRRIAGLHEERVHILASRHKLPVSSGNRPTVDALRGMRVSLGPEQSGTRVLAEAILTHHDVPPTSIGKVFLSVPEMVCQLHGGEIDAGFFVGAVPSEAIKTILADDRVRLLSIDRPMMAKMLGSALEVSRIAPGTYGCQLVGEDAVETISTRAVLVTTKDVPFDVGRITRILFEGAHYLGVEGGAEAMARGDFSIPLHPAAVGYYRKAGYLPSRIRFDWLAAAWRSLAIIVILVGGYQGVLKLRRDRVANEVGRRVFAISVSASEPDSVRKLVEIRSEIEERVRNRWWRREELDKSRWRSLSGLIESRINEAKENLTRSLLTEIRAVKGSDGLAATARDERFSVLEERIWKHMEHGELTESQHHLLLKVFREGPSREG
jgi:TRAP transporter TAXI family solute receptor